MFRLLVLFWVLLIGAVRAGIAQNLYWDTNGIAAGTGSGPPTWDLETLHWGDAAGTAETVAWSNTGAATAVFSAGFDADATHEVTLTAGGALFLKGVEVEEGTVRLRSGAPVLDRLDFGTSASSLVVQGNSTLILDTAVDGTGGLAKSGAGRVVVNVSAPQGAFSISAGVLEFGPNVRGAGSLTLGGGAGLAATLVLADSAIFDLSGNLTFSNVGAPQAALITGGVIALNGNRSVVTQNISAAVDLTIESAITDGAESSSLTKTGGGTLLLAGTNLYTGATLLPAGAGMVRVEGNEASIASSGAIGIGPAATLSVGSTADTAPVDRLGDSATITLTGAVQGGASLIYTAADPALQGIHEEQTGQLVVAGDHRSFITLTPGAGDELEILAEGIAREGNAVLLLRGAGLGAAEGTANSTRVKLANAPALVGGLLPWAIGDVSATGSGGGFLTYDGQAGLRQLAESEYAAPAGAAPGANVRKSTAGNLTLANDLSVNSWTNAASGSTNLATRMLTIESGGMLFAASGTITGGVIDFAAQQGIIHLAAGVAVTATINSEIRGDRGLIVSGTGGGNKTVVLGGDNRFAGGVRIYTGILQLNNSGALNPSGINELHVQTGGTLRLNGNSLFMASLHGAGNVLNNHATDSAEIALGAGGSFNGTINDGDGGPLSLTNNNGLLVLGGSNNYTGTTRVRGGQFHVNPAGANPGVTGRLASTVSVFVGREAVFQINNGNAAYNHADRVNDAAPIAMDGGNIVYNHTATTGVAYSETLGALSLTGGANSITTSRASANGGTSALTFASIDRVAGSVINLSGTELGLSTRNRLDILTLGEGFIGGWATVGNDFAKYVTDLDVGLAGRQGSITAFAASDYSSTAANDAAMPWSREVHAKPATDQANAHGMTQAKEVASLNLANGIDLNMGTTGSLNIVSGGLIKQGGVSGSSASQRSQIIGGSITAGGNAQAAELFVRVTGANLTIGSKIIDNSGDGVTAGVVSLVKSGPGNLILNGANTYSGETWVHSGVLQVGSGGTGTVPAAGTTGFGRLEMGPGAVLAGSGLVRGNLVLNGGEWRPGDTTSVAGDGLGTLWVGADVMFSKGLISLQISQPTLKVPGLADAASPDYHDALAALAGSSELAGPISMTQHDRIHIDGSFDWSSGQGQITVLDQGYQGAAGDVFKLLDWSAALNPWSHSSGSRFRTDNAADLALTLPILNGGLAWDTHLWSTHGILVVTAPEPSRALLVVLGAAGLLMTRRRRKSHSFSA